MRLVRAKYLVAKSRRQHNFPCRGVGPFLLQQFRLMKLNRGDIQTKSYFEMSSSVAPMHTTFIAPLPISPSSFNVRVTSSFPRPQHTLLSPHTQVSRTPNLKNANTPRQTITSKASSNPPPTIPEDSVPYFAYFANMNPNKIGPLARSSLRRCDIYHSQTARLPSHKVVFDVPGPPPEPAFANLVEDSSSTVHGILHWLARSDFDRVALSEGVFRGGPLRVLAPLMSFARVKDIQVMTTNDDGGVITTSAKTIVFNSRVPEFVRSRLRPSRRYVQVAVDGAEYWGIDKAYVAKLRSISIDIGPLGGFGLFVEPRPHFLDRPNSYERFGKPSSEIYSPFGPIGATAAVEAIERDNHGTQGKDVRLVRVSNATRESASGRKSLYYVPGIDGTGKGILSQVDGLDREGIYDVSTFVYPSANRQSLQELAEDLIRIIKEDAGEKPVSLVGESMGGVINLLLAVENERRLRKDSQLPSLNIDLLMLINPATSFKRSSPRALWDFLLSLGLSKEMYAQLLPPVLLPFVVDIDAMRNKLGPDLFPRLRKVMLSLTELSELLPQDALTWRLKLLSEFSVGKDDLHPLGGEYGPSKVALISSVNDNLIPSHSESYRLRRYIPNLYTMILPYGGHVPSFDSRFSLAAFLKAFNVAPESTTTKSRVVPSPYVLKRRAALTRRFTKETENLSEEKTREELGKLRAFLEKFTQDSSPVFIGEENIPHYDPSRPTLFVCNHTLLGWLDAMYPVQRILKQRSVLLRSLAHPILFKQAEQGRLAFPNTTKVSQADLVEFGILKVSPRQLLEQLARKRWCLLFPGGAKEALKEGEEQKYSLKWPEDPEFIRACAIFGAQIIPVSTVGSEDMVRIIASPKQVASVIDSGSRLIGRPVDWSAVSFEALTWRDNKASQEDAPLIPPFMLPKRPDRIYFKFGKPIDIDEACSYDKNLERQVYEKVYDSVSKGIEVLLKRRELDDYRTIEKRREFKEKFGENAIPPCGNAWLWSKNGSFLDEDKQPPL